MSPSHEAILPNVPPENIIALFDSWDMPLADLLDMIGEKPA